MGIWIELGVFLLVFVFAGWQFHDLKRERQKRLAREAERKNDTAKASTAPAATSPHEETR